MAFPSTVATSKMPQPPSGWLNPRVDCQTVTWIEGEASQPLHHITRQITINQQYPIQEPKANISNVVAYFTNEQLKTAIPYILIEASNATHTLRCCTDPGPD